MTGIEYRLPDVGEGLDQAEIVSWKVRPGDAVSEDDVLVEIETDKSVVEVPSPYTGVIESLGGEEGDTVEVGAVLAVFVPQGTVASSAARQPAAAAPETSPRRARGHDSVSEGANTDDARPSVPGRGFDSATTGGRIVPASPSTRRRAVELGVDLGRIWGTGPGGRVTRDDVETVATEPASSTPARAPAASRSPATRTVHSREDEVVPLRGLRREIARVMSEAQQVPIIYEWRDVPAGRLMEVRRRFVEQHPDRRDTITLLPFVAKALIGALRAHPRFNARIDLGREEIVSRGDCHLGIATATPDGLIVPVVRNAEQLSLFELGEEIGRLAAAARDRKLTVDEVRDGTCTISNYGSFGTRTGAPLIRPPEVTILGVGRAHEQVVAENGEPVVRMMLPISVGTDHRLNDGDALAAFCDTLTARLSEPALVAGDA